jgi:acyl-CoA thioesterase FadM
MIYGDVAHCEISVIKMGKTSISWRFRIHNQSNELCWSAVQTTVCTNMDSIGEKLDIPMWVREGLDCILE